MFGIFRYILASMVAIAHLGPYHMTHVGIYAVLAFFTPSGYLMTLNLKERYFLMPGGVSKYYANRLLRVLPGYYAIALFSLFVLYSKPDIALSIHEYMRLPETLWGWISHITVVGLTSVIGERDTHSLIPPAWSLAVEIVFWALIPLFIRTRWAWWLWGIVSVIYTLAVINDQSPVILRYNSYFSASFLFFLSTQLYHLRRTDITYPWWSVVVPIAATLTYYLLSQWLWDDPMHFTYKMGEAEPYFTGFYVAIALNFWCIFLLIRFDGTSLHARLRTWDEFLGRLSYPIFLLHLPAAAFTVWMLQLTGFDIPATVGWLLFFVTFPVMNLLAMAVSYGIEQPIEKLRAKIRG